MAMDKKAIEKYIEINRSSLPIHSNFWEVAPINSSPNSYNISHLNNGIVRPDLMYKPLSTFFKLSDNANK